jgi:shikimate dehydrogenase
MVIGNPIEHSKSPLIHNVGYQALGIDDQFVYVACQVKPQDIEAFTKGAKAMGVRGISCTMPHKEIIMPYLDKIDPVATKIGAVNTVVREGDELVGHNTDWIGVVAPLKNLTSLTGKKVTVIGAGGAAKAMVYGLCQEGAIVTICNILPDQAEALAKQYGCKFAPLNDLPALKEADIICNATPLGMGDFASRTPVDSKFLSGHQIIFDAVYAPYNTRLLKEAAACGAQVVHGTDMLLYQAMAQFKLYTGQEAPEDAMRSALKEDTNE